MAETFRLTPPVAGRPAYFQRLPQADRRFGVVASLVVHAAKVILGKALAPRVVKLAPDSQRRVEVFYRLVELPELAADVGQVVKGYRLAPLVGDAAANGKGALSALQRLIILSLFPVGQAHPVNRPSFAQQEADLLACW